MEFKDHMDVWVKKGSAAVSRGTELARDKIERTRRIIELKKQLKNYQAMMNSAYQEIGKNYVAAVEENRELLDVDAWIEQIHTAQEMIAHLKRQLAQLEQI